MARRAPRVGWGLSVVAALGGCSAEGPDRLGQTGQALDAPVSEALCEVPVDGLGLVATETDYLPRVVACENGGADLEALKAQAIAARSVVYWTVGTQGSICDGQGCQAYSCANEPLPIHQQAVDETSGQYLAYGGNVTYAFYVNGDPDTAPPTCVGDPAAPNEQWVTYNEGLSGGDVIQTALGSQHDPNDPSYGQNRGCMGQWGARCLEAMGYAHEAILRAYYGEDIAILKAEGPCVLEGPSMEGVGGGGTGGARTGGSGGGASAGGAGPEAGAGPTIQQPSLAAEEAGACAHAGGGRRPVRAWPLLVAFVVAFGRRRRGLSPRRTSRRAEPRGPSS